MKRHVILLRGINVGGKNKLPMADLRKCLEGLGFTNVRSYIASGNVLLDSERSSTDIAAAIEAALPKRFLLDSTLIKVLVMDISQLQSVIDNKPSGFGENPQLYHSDAIFLIDINKDEAMAVFSPRDGVDTIWPGNGVIYSQRLSAERTKSRLGKIVGTKPYASMTIRTWNTVIKLLELAND